MVKSVKTQPVTCRPRGLPQKQPTNINYNTAAEIAHETNLHLRVLRKPGSGISGARERIYISI